MSTTAGRSEESAGDFVDVLLGLAEEGDEKLSESDMIAVLWVRKKTGTFNVHSFLICGRNAHRVDALTYMSCMQVHPHIMI
jgi:hypothetical protein